MNCDDNSDAQSSTATTAEGPSPDGSESTAGGLPSGNENSTEGMSTPSGGARATGDGTSQDDRMQPTAGGAEAGDTSTGGASTDGTTTEATGGTSSGDTDTTGGTASVMESSGGSGGTSADEDATGGASANEAAAGETATGGADMGGDISEDATFVPHADWACGMADGILAPTQGDLAFTITLDISGEHEVGNTPYGYRRLLDVSGGTISGDQLQGSIMTGGLEYELTLSNGVMEYQGINILETGDGSRIFVRSCGVAPDENSTPRIIPDFEATTSGSYAFLNTGSWVATREVADGTMTLEVYDVSGVTAGEPRVEITKPDGVPPQPWECNMTRGNQGPEVFTENVTLGGSFSIPNAKYGSRNIIPITGGTTTGRVTGAILDGGADYQLSGSLDAWYTLAPDNGEFILVRNCGANGGLIPWFEAAVDGEFDFLNSQAYLSSSPAVGGGGVSITFYERQ